MALSLISPFYPPSPPRSRRSPFAFAFSPLTPIPSRPPTSSTFAPEQPSEPHLSTPDSIPDSTTSVSVYATPLSAPPSPPVLPAWRAVPPTPPTFLSFSPPLHPPVRRRTHPRPASAVFPGARTVAAQRRLSLPTRAIRSTDSATPPSAFRVRRRRSSLGSEARRLFHIQDDDDAASDDGDDTPDRQCLDPVKDEYVPKRSALQRRHALLELLQSECSYLADLRTLVNIYLEQLPMLVSPKALTLPLLSPTYSATFAFGRPEEAFKDRDRERDKDREKRALLSDNELNAIRRNAVQLLELHETLSSMLSDAVRVSGWVAGLRALEGSGEFGSEPSFADTEDTEERFENALKSVATLFTAQAPTFNVYEAFCAEHPGAIEIVNSLQRKRPVEWDAFERRCTELIAANLGHADDSRRERDGAAGEEEETSSREQYPDPDTNDQHEEQPHGLRPPTSLDDSPPSLLGRPRSNHDLKRAALTNSKDTKKDNVAERDPRLRLQFTDYLIKPVQRICKYPLLLGPLTLERRPRSFSEADAIVIDAKQAMTDAAALVDSANFSHLQLQQTSRISARLSAPAAVLAFIRTLSPCALAGSLDVVRAPALKAKYLAAFLYEGGFLALAKVNRGPRYDLRYWFSLEGFELSDTMDRDPLLPYSFRLYKQGQEFEIAASCQREKQVWMDALRGCLENTPPWPPGTAPSSLELVSGIAEAHSHAEEQVPPLPTVQSLHEIETPHKAGPPASPLPGQKSAPRAESPVPRVLSEPPPSRRESATSLMSIFGPVIDPNAVTVIRASPQARSAVDALLEDVFSTACHSARIYAETHSETLFHVSPTFGAAARSRLTKRESVHVRRRRSYVELPGPAQSIRISRKVRPDKAPPALALDCITSVEQVGVVSLVPSPDGLFDSPIVVSQCSSSTGSRVGSNAASPLTDAVELPSSLPDTCSSSGSDPKSLGPRPEDLLEVREVPPKRSRSLVENVRGFILPHSTPPVRTLSVSRISVLPAPTPSSTSTPSSPSQRRFSWRASIRRRSRSSPFVSSDILDPVAAAAAALSRHSAEHSPSASATIAPGQHFPWNIDAPVEGRSDPSLQSTPPPPATAPRRTLFGCAPAPRGSPTVPRNMLRSIFESFSRSPSSTSVAQGP